MTAAGDIIDPAPTIVADDHGFHRNVVTPRATQRERARARPRAGRLAGTSVALLAFGALAATWRLVGTSEVYDFDTDAAAIVATTLDDGARMMEPPATARDPVGFARAWAFDVDATWKDYLTWLTPRLATRFAKAAVSDSEVRYVDAREGDIYILVLRRQGLGPPLRIGARFVADAR